MNGFWSRRRPRLLPNFFEICTTATGLPERVDSGSCQCYFHRRLGIMSLPARGDPLVECRTTSNRHRPRNPIFAFGLCVITCSQLSCNDA